MDKIIEVARQTVVDVGNLKSDTRKGMISGVYDNVYQIQIAKDSIRKGIGTSLEYLENTNSLVGGCDKAVLDYFKISR